MSVASANGPGPSDHRDYARTGPGTLAGRYLRRSWQPVARSADLGPGEATRITVMGEEHTLYRGAEGAAHVVANRCAHRGEQLSIGWVEGDCIRCFYHGCSYDGKGSASTSPLSARGWRPR